MAGTNCAPMVSLIIFLTHICSQLSRQ